MSKARINLSDSGPTMVSKMCEGNPGAMHVLLEMMKSDDIDPDNPLGGFGKILLLDSLGIYGSDIYVLHNDVCEQNMVKTFTVLRGWQLGFISRDLVKDVSSRQDRSGKGKIDIEEVHKRIKERLPNFKDL